MKEKGRVVLVLAVVLLAAAALWATLSWAAPGGVLAPPPAGIPPVVAYQGEVQVSGSPYTGHGYFKFAVVDAAGATTYWSNDGSSGDGGEPAEAVPLDVSEGLFSVLLGDTALQGMTEPLVAEVFGEPECHLRVWFSASDTGPFEQLAPDTRIAAVPYALRAQEAANADTVDGLHASQLGAGYQNVVVVAKSGGDYASVQAAIDSISDAAADNSYLVWVAPGVYSETVTMKPHVHVQGAGQEATVISSAASSGSVPSEATLVLASDTSLRDVTVGNTGEGTYNAALLAANGVTRTLVADVSMRAQGTGTNNCVAFLDGAGTRVNMQQVTGLAENGSGVNYGLYLRSGAAASVVGGSLKARGGSFAVGIYSVYSGARLEADGVIVVGEGATGGNYGLQNFYTASAALRGGSFMGRGGNTAHGIHNQGGTLEAEGVISLGENGTYNYGLRNVSSAGARLRGGSYTGRGGTEARGIYNLNATLEAGGVSALGENGSGNNRGLSNEPGGVAVLRGGSFTARGGTEAHGIVNANATLEMGAITVLAEDASSYNYGLLNQDSAAATMRGGSFIARGGATAVGIHSTGSETILEAEGTTVLGENASTYNHGLRNYSVMVLRGGSFTARGGTEAYGIVNSGSDAALETSGITALGEGGSSSNEGLFNTVGAEASLTQSVLEGATSSVSRIDGTVTVSNSRLVGGPVAGSVTCVLVTRGGTVSTDGSTCP